MHRLEGSYERIHEMIEAAWLEVHAALPPGWFVGHPAFESRRAVPWSMYAFDTTEKPKIGHRSREWTAMAPTELDVLVEMARCLGEIRLGRVPK